MRSISSRWIGSAWLGLLVVMPVAGCHANIDSAPDVQVALVLEPSPPMVGDVDVSLDMSDASGSPLVGAAVRLEGNMNHAGMKPSFADLREVEPGHYAGSLEFTMGGDWFILVTATTSDGKTVERTVEVPGVKSK